MFHETNTLIPLEYSTYHEALADAKFYSQVFIEAAWNNAIANKSFESIYNEFLKLAGNFELEPNETNFNFCEYFKKYYKLYNFEKSLEDTWRGMIV